MSIRVFRGRRVRIRTSKAMVMARRCPTPMPASNRCGGFGRREGGRSSCCCSCTGSGSCSIEVQLWIARSSHLIEASLEMSALSILCLKSLLEILSPSILAQVQCQSPILESPLVILCDPVHPLPSLHHLCPPSQKRFLNNGVFKKKYPLQVIHQPASSILCDSILTMIPHLTSPHLATNDRRQQRSMISRT